MCFGRRLSYSHSYSIVTSHGLYVKSFMIYVLKAAQKDVVMIGVWIERFCERQFLFAVQQLDKFIDRRIEAHMPIYIDNHALHIPYPKQHDER